MYNTSYKENLKLPGTAKACDNLQKQNKKIETDKNQLIEKLKQQIE
jgi:hypothetical protein